MKNLLEKAISIAVEAHAGQKDKAGEPYILHPLYLMMKCPHNDTHRIVAVLHDVIEDGGLKYRDKIIETGFDDEIITALDYLTHDKRVKYFDYIRNIKNNELAKSIKILDLNHNCDLTRLNAVTDKDKERVLKYLKSVDILYGLEE